MGKAPFGEIWEKARGNLVRDGNAGKAKAKVCVCVCVSGRRRGSEMVPLARLRLRWVFYVVFFWCMIVKSLIFN